MSIRTRAVAAIVLGFAGVGLAALAVGCGPQEVDPKQAAIDRRDAEYNRQTFEVMRKVLAPDGCCIDVGAYKGSILEKMVEFAPEGTHHAFEPLPAFAALLTEKFPSPNVRIYELALGDRAGFTTFQHVVTNPGYSGIKKRTYERADEVVEPIEVKIDTLDHALPAGARVDFIKIDVEGAELLVLRGARETIRRTRPVIVFEHGLGAADHYGATPEQVWALLVDDLKMRITLMERWLRGEPAFTRDEFIDQFRQGKNYYFLSGP
jgi:FkbM family methyltransferase